ncbi:fibrobacter succinogenes major paralogous domain-containing protein [Mangrovibacterium diazotrophicum]|uniref:Uncharacterized protein (TIGR02145 family) n=1 Tax=Mangrovibacterium diazotrophicum TaxID=1261403 RepID=A0A419W856_9BACT|nr:fibrobacter succinogenes major paralogous domain-containing protein [Mangrovibacterium diazotrophicum]RKD91638.1 uncharacterized protein (TIGR02145 family) [Mangrovibacterium diazotrophicum]
MKKMLFQPRFLSIFMLCLFLISCSKSEDDTPEEENTDIVTPTIVTNYASCIDINSATASASISETGSSAITASGFCWSTSQLPTIDDSKTSGSVTEGDFTASLSNLSSNTLYYVRAYATNGAGTGYGEAVPLKTYTGQITDIDGNTYFTVTIGNQLWTAENLKVRHYRNGDEISSTEDDGGNYYIYDNDENNASIYGLLYNWYAANDSRNICPEGWHVPTADEWDVLIEYLGGFDVAAPKLCEATGQYWILPETYYSTSTDISTNESGFTALPAGIAEYAEVPYQWLGIDAGFWTTTESTSSSTHAQLRDMVWGIAKVYSLNHFKYVGHSLRLIKDN